MLRRWVLILLCLALPGLGMASTLADMPPCTMSPEDMAQMLQSADPGQALPDCCNDAATWAATGQACKADVDGAAPVVAPPVQVRSAVDRVSARDLAPPPAMPWLHAPPPTVWRPPAAC